MFELNNLSSRQFRRIFCQRTYIKCQLSLDLAQKVCKSSIGFTGKIYMGFTTSHSSFQNDWGGSFYSFVEKKPRHCYQKRVA